MASAYTLLANGMIQRSADGVFIPADPANKDYEAYLAWVAAGNVVAPAPSPTISQQAGAQLAAGVTITSTSTPELDGTYSCDASATSQIQAEIVSLLLNGTFTNGTAAMTWYDKAGAPHSFSVAEFKAFATSVAAYVGTLAAIAASNARTLPSSVVTIA